MAGAAGAAASSMGAGPRAVRAVRPLSSRCPERPAALGAAAGHRRPVSRAAYSDAGAGGAGSGSPLESSELERRRVTRRARRSRARARARAGGGDAGRHAARSIKSHRAVGTLSCAMSTAVRPPSECVTVWVYRPATPVTMSQPTITVSVPAWGGRVPGFKASSLPREVEVSSAESAQRFGRMQKRRERDRGTRPQPRSRGTSSPPICRR